MQGIGFRQIEPNQEVLDFWPRDDLIIVGEGKDAIRFIYSNQYYTPIELQVLNELKAMIARIGLQLPPRFDDGELVRFIYGNSWNASKALKSVQEYIEFYNKNLIYGYQSKYFFLRNLCRKGVAYIQGRDCFYRPIFVVNFGLINDFDVDQYIDFIIFFLELIIDKMMIPGKIENWIILGQVGNNDIYLSFSDIRKIVHVLQNYFRGRLYRVYISKVSKKFNFIWKVVKPFLSTATSSKIFLSMDNHHPLMWTHISRNQIEKQYGGYQNNQTIFWPPQIRNVGFSVNYDNIFNETNDRYQWESGLSKLRPNQTDFELEDDDIIIGQGKSACRLIYETHWYSDLEQRKINKLRQRIRQKGLMVPQNLTDGELLRFVYGSKWKTANAYKNIEQYINWKQSSCALIWKQLYDKVHPLLQEGYMYIQTRDNKQRPVIVLQFDEIDVDKFDIDT